MLRDGLTGYHQEQSTLGICSRNPSSKGCGLCGGTHLNKECSFNEEVKGVEEVKYGELEDLFQTMIDQLTKDFQAKASKEAPGSSTSIGHCKAKFANIDAQSVGTCSNETKELHEVSFISNCDVQVSKNLNMYALADLVEMAGMSKKAPIGIVENVLVKINRFVLPSGFVVIDMLGDPNKTMILGRPEPLTRRKGKTKVDEPGLVTWRLHSYKHIWVMSEDLSRFRPNCDPNLKDFNRGDSIYGRDEHGILKQWCCYYDNKRWDIKCEDMDSSNYL
ncbi:hypothetical protein Tco_0775168 [Tanacetum coccineum]